MEDNRTEEEKRKHAIEAIEKAFISGNEEDTFKINFLIVSLISADSLLCKEDCDHSITELNLLKEIFQKANIPPDKKAEYLVIIESGIQICERDKEILPSIEDEE